MQIILLKEDYLLKKRNNINSLPLFNNIYAENYLKIYIYIYIYKFIYIYIYIYIYIFFIYIYI